MAWERMRPVLGVQTNASVHVRVCRGPDHRLDHRMRSVGLVVRPPAARSTQAGGKVAAGEAPRCERLAS